MVNFSAKMKKETLAQNESVQNMIKESKYLAIRSLKLLLKQYK